QENKTVSAKVSLWGPTNIRSEVRIGRFYTVAGWEIPADEFNKDFTTGVVWFYLLMLDDNKNVWARTMRSTTIGKNEPGFDACITGALKRKRSLKKTVRGVYYFPKQVIAPL